MKHMSEAQCNSQHPGNSDKSSSESEQPQLAISWQQIGSPPQQQNIELCWHGCSLGLWGQLQNEKGYNSEMQGTVHGIKKLKYYVRMHIRTYVHTYVHTSKYA